jgi:hypothetical protein
VIDFSQFELRMQCSCLQNPNEHLTVEEFIQKLYTSEQIFPQAEDLPPENDKEGPTEYKLKLIDHHRDTIESKTSQMRFRIGEGEGEGYYRLAYEDDGIAKGISKEDAYRSFRILDLLRIALLHGTTVKIEDKSD